MHGVACQHMGGRAVLIGHQWKGRIAGRHPSSWPGPTAAPRGRQLVRDGMGWMSRRGWNGGGPSGGGGGHRRCSTTRWPAVQHDVLHLWPFWHPEQVASKHVLNAPTGGEPPFTVAAVTKGGLVGLTTGTAWVLTADRRTLLSVWHWRKVGSWGHYGS